MIFRILSILLFPFAKIFSLWAMHVHRPNRIFKKRARVGFTVRRDIAYMKVGAKPLLADIYVPRLPGPLPAVLMIHGGGWSSGERSQTAGQAERVAARGYVVMNATYRLAPGARFPAQLQDLQQALRWMRASASEFRIDPTRIGTWGYSAGAHLATLLGSLRPGDRLYSEDARVAVVVAGGTPADLRKFRGGTFVPEFLGEKWAENSTIFRESSPATYVSRGNPPVFLYHGTWDLLVPLNQATDYQKALDHAHVPNELYLMRGLGHVAAFLMDGEAIQRGADFLDRHLRAFTGEQQPEVVSDRQAQERTPRSSNKRVSEEGRSLDSWRRP